MPPDLARSQEWSYKAEAPSPGTPYKAETGSGAAGLKAQAPVLPLDLKP